MTHSITSDLDPKIMTMKSFNLLCDTLQEEICNHPHKDELLNLIESQMLDECNFSYLK